MAGLYIHIPFCASRCIYCDFYSTTSSQELQDKYVDAVIREMQLRSDYLKGEPIHTIYIGGGTPSLLSHKNLMKLSKALPSEFKEFTMECNPDDISEELVRTMNSIGVNRVSMGVQTFNDARLRFLNRRHRAKQIKPAIQLLRKHGIENISIDLMFGFPKQTINEWTADLQMAIALHPEHISAYSLMYEEGTVLYRLLQENKIEEVKEELSREMYELLISTLQANGYEHYEISNFALPSFHSMHNSSYWDDISYMGCGAAAHSYYNGLRKSFNNGSRLYSRQWNINDIDQYIQKIYNGEIPAEIELLDEDTHYNDIITTALRTSRGINLSTLSSDNYRDYLLHNAEKSLKQGLLQIKDNHIMLTHEGLFVSDDVMSDLVKVKT